MNLSLDDAFFFQDALCVQEAVQASIHREPRKLPFDDPGKPNQRTHIIKPDGPEALPSIQDLKTGLGEPIFRDLQILIRKRQIRMTAEQLHQLPVVLGPHLLGEEQPTRLQHPVDLVGIEIPMTVDHHIKGCIPEGQHPLAVRRPEINPKRQQRLPAQLHIRRIIFRCGGVV